MIGRLQMSTPFLSHYNGDRRKLGIDQDVDSGGSESSGTQKLKRRGLQSVRQEEGVWVCKYCGYRYDGLPRAQVRREHKKNCPGRHSLKPAEEGEAWSGDSDIDFSLAVSEYVQPDLPFRAQEDAATDTSTPRSDTRTGDLELEDPTGKEEPIEERERVGAGDGAIGGPVAVVGSGHGDSGSEDIDQSDKVDERVGTEVRRVRKEGNSRVRVSKRFISSCLLSLPLLGGLILLVMLNSGGRIRNNHRAGDQLRKTVQITTRHNTVIQNFYLKPNCFEDCEYMEL